MRWRNQESTMDLGAGTTAYRKDWQVQERSKWNKRRNGKARCKNYGERGWEVTDIRKVEGIHWNEVVPARPRGHPWKLKLRFCVGDLDLPERRFTSIREEEHVATHMWRWGTSIETRTHNRGGCEICKVKRDELEKGTRNKTKVCNIKLFRDYRVTRKRSPS